MGWLEMLVKKQPLSKLSSTSGIAAYERSPGLKMPLLLRKKREGAGIIERLLTSPPRQRRRPHTPRATNHPRFILGSAAATTAAA